MRVRVRVCVVCVRVCGGGIVCVCVCVCVCVHVLCVCVRVCFVCVLCVYSNFFPSYFVTTYLHDVCFWWYISSFISHKDIPVIIISITVFIRPAQYFNVTTSAQSREHMNIHVEWPDSLEEVEYIVTVADPNISAIPNCTSPGDNPPCFLARGTVS